MSFNITHFGNMVLYYVIGYAVDISFTINKMDFDPPHANVVTRYFTHVEYIKLFQNQPPLR